jgi:hypothetical protein
MSTYTDVIPCFVQRIYVTQNLPTSASLRFSRLFWRTLFPGVTPLPTAEVKNECPLHQYAFTECIRPILPLHFYVYFLRCRLFKVLYEVEFPIQKSYIGAVLHKVHLPRLSVDYTFTISTKFVCNR